MYSVQTWTDDDVHRDPHKLAPSTERSRPTEVIHIIERREIRSEVFTYEDRWKLNGEIGYEEVHAYVL